MHELIDINWRIKRIRFTQTNALIENMEAQRQRQDAPEASVSMLARAEREGSTSTGEQLLLDRRVAALSTTRARILRDLERLARRFPNRAGSQSALETENLSFEISWKVPADPAEPAQEDILSWVEENATIEPDSAQTAILTAETPEITVATNAETTAGAIRAVYEAVQNPGATIACKSSGLMQRARDFARQLGLALTPPPPGAGGFTLPNGSQVVFDPGTVTPRLTVVHKQTPGWRVDCPEEGGGDVSPDIRPGR